MLKFITVFTVCACTFLTLFTDNVLSNSVIGFFFSLVLFWTAAQPWRKVWVMPFSSVPQLKCGELILSEETANAIANYSCILIVSQCWKQLKSLSVSYEVLGIWYTVFIVGNWHQHGFLLTDRSPYCGSSNGWWGQFLNHRLCHSMGIDLRCLKWDVEEPFWWGLSRFFASAYWQTQWRSSSWNVAPSCKLFVHAILFCIRSSQLVLFIFNFLRLILMLSLKCFFLTSRFSLANI